MLLIQIFKPVNQKHTAGAKGLGKKRAFAQEFTAWSEISQKKRKADPA
jgi:hypothetical protein